MLTAERVLDSFTSRFVFSKKNNKKLLSSSKHEDLLKSDAQSIKQKSIDRPTQSHTIGLKLPSY